MASPRTRGESGRGAHWDLVAVGEFGARGVGSRDAEG